MIASARRFIYAENQYFASRKIAEAMAARLADPDPPEIVLINPETADGPLQEEAMGSARARLMEKLEQMDHRRRFRIYRPEEQTSELQSLIRTTSPVVSCKTRTQPIS